MRIVQSVLLVIGAASLGIVACGLGLAIVATMIFFRPRPGSEPGLNWGAAFGFMGCGACGSVFGVTVGLVAAIRWIKGHGHELWTPFTWLGILLGMALALAFRFSAALEGFGIIHELIQWWLGTIIFLAASGTVGGIAGGLLGPAGRSKKDRENRPRVRRIQLPE